MSTATAPLSITVSSGTSGTTAIQTVGFTQTAGASKVGGATTASQAVTPTQAAAATLAGGSVGAAETVTAIQSAGAVALASTAVTQPQVPTFTAGYQPEPGDFDSWIQVPFAWLTRKVVFRAERAAGATWTAGAPTLIPFDTIDEDTFGGWNAGSSSWTPPVNGTGTYEVSVTCSAAGSADTTTALRCILYLNGSPLYTMSTSQAAESQPCLTGGSAPLQLYGGQDAVSVYAYWNTSGANGSAVTTAGQRCSIEVTWISL